MMKDYLTYSELSQITKELISEIEASGDLEENGGFDTIVAITRGGLFTALQLSHYFNIKDVRIMSLVSYDEHDTREEIIEISSSEIPDCNTTLVVDDLVDSGSTLQYIKNKYPNVKTAVLITKDSDISDTCTDYVGRIKDKNSWIVFPWEEIFK